MADRTAKGQLREPDARLVIVSPGDQALFTAIFDRAGIGIVICTRQGRTLAVNPAMAKMMGRLPEDLCEHHISQFTHPEDVLLGRERRNQLLRGEIESYRIEKRYLRPDGQTLWGELTVTLIPGLDGEGLLLGMIVDITERKRTEEALQSRSKELKEAQRMARIGSALRDLGTGTIVWSDELYRIFGLDPRQSPPTWMELKSFFAPESQARLQSAKERLFREHQGFELELELIRADGAVRWLTYRAEVELDANGRPSRYLTTIQDNTERWMSNQALRESEEKYRGMVETMTEGVWVLDQEDRTTFVNQQMAAMLGYRVEEMLGRHLLDFKDDEARPIARQALERRRQGITEQYDSTFQTKDGRRLRVLISTRPLTDGQGRYTGSLGIIANINERVLLEERLRQAHKMEAVGRLAGGVAHDFNNLLTVINGHSDLLLGNISAADRIYRHLKEIRIAGQRAQELTSQMLAFSRHQIRSNEILSVQDVIEETGKMLRRLLKADIEIVTVFEPVLGNVRADRIDLTQILMNLAVNAQDAMPTGGTLTFEAANVDIDEQYARTHPGARRGAYVALSVTDTGVGMDAEVQEHLFEPFFTTKEAGRGTGLGLATVYGIVSQCGGWIRVHTRPHEGTKFRIYFPRVDGIALEERNHVEVSDQRPGGTETILVVEDQSQVRRLICAMLKELGYQTLEASDGEEALRVAQAHAGSLHLLLTDIVMPGMDGLELATRLTNISPTRTLFMSGYAANIDAAYDFPAAYIQKPISLDALAKKVREVLQ